MRDLAAAQWAICAFPAIGALMAVWLACLLRERGIRPLRALARLMRRPHWEALAVLACVGGLVHHGATKHVASSPSGPDAAMAVPDTSLAAQAEADSGPSPGWTNAACGVCATGISPGETSILIRAHWPSPPAGGASGVEVYARPRLDAGGWSGVGTAAIPAGADGVAIEIPRSILPPGGAEAMFFTLGLDSDTDGDGLSDAFERLVSATDPLLADTDGDSLPDGWECRHGFNPLSAPGMGEADADADGDGLPNAAEFALGTDPLNADTDGDGLSDCDEAGCIVLADGFEWHDAAGLPETCARPPDGGLHSHFGASAIAQLADGTAVLGDAMARAVCFDNGVVYMVSPGPPGPFVFPERPTPLDWADYSMGDILVAPYWCGSGLVAGDASSFMRVGVVAGDGCFVAEYRNVGLCGASGGRMTCQVIVPGGTGNVVRVSYLSSDDGFGGSGAVAGVQVRRIATVDGLYNLAWDFAERGPIPSGTTVEYRLGHGTDPLDADTDGDGLSDGDEVCLHRTNPLRADSDGDGLSDMRELALGTDPMSPDTDGDGLLDGWEAAHGLDPLVPSGDDGADADVDGDGLTNIQEQRRGTDPHDADTDGDGLSDGQEVNVHGTSPTVADTDGDGLNDGEEINHGTDPLRADTDFDGLSDGAELRLGTDPRQPDTDGDGLTDGWEHESGYDPTVDNNTDADPDNDADADPDGDGLTNGDENDWGTRPNLPDTDGDGVSDGAEALGASDPLDASDGGNPGSCRLVRLEFGDPSGSRSEKYVLSVAPVAGTGTGTLPRSHAFLNREYGECETKTVALKPGWRYEVMLYWAACKHSGEGYPDYDYRLLLADANLTSGVFLDDPEGLFVANDDTSTTFAGENKTAYLDVVNLKIISDRQMPYDECRDGALIDCRTATVGVEPCVAGSTLANRSFDLVCTPVENGALVNDNRGTAVTAKKIGLNIWRTSPIYWYGVLPDRDCSKYHHEYSFDLRENGKTVISRKCPVGWPESNAFSAVLPPSENDTHRSEAKFYHSKSEDYWYCEIIFEPFNFEQGSICTEPDGVNFTWTGQYADKIRAEEEFHIKQVKGEVPTSQGGQGDCYTIKGLKYFISQQAISNQNVVTSTWIVKGKTRQEAEDNADAVIANAVKQELVESLKIRFADRGFMEYAVKRHLNYNAAFRYHCSYEETYGSNPINHSHPAYVSEGE